MIEYMQHKVFWSLPEEGGKGEQGRSWHLPSHAPCVLEHHE